MKRSRPYIPLSVRVVVAERQLVQRGIWNAGHVEIMKGSAAPAAHRLRHALGLMFHGEPVHLDHDPPLRWRKFNKRTGRYTPDANDPRHLIYRTKEDHQIKTNVRGDGAQFPDRVLIKRERRREKKAIRDRVNKAFDRLDRLRGMASKKRPQARGPKRKLASRPFPEGRGFQRRAKDRKCRRL